MTSVVICIAATSTERSRLAGLFSGEGVLVLAADAASAQSFLDGLPGAPPARGDGLVVDTAAHEATWFGLPLPLTRRELAVLDCLAGRVGQVWTYEQLHLRAWEGAYVGPAAVQSVVKRLRAKLREAGVTMRVGSVRGVGFRLQAAEPVPLGLVAAAG